MHPYVAHNRFLRKNKRTRTQTSTEVLPLAPVYSNLKKPQEDHGLAYQRTRGPDVPFPGEIVKGQISRVVNFGAFVRVGEFTGLVHLSELAWKRVSNARDLVSEGETLDFKVMKYDPETQRLALSRKALLPDPWVQIRQHYPTDTRVKARITGFSSHGVHVNLEEGIEGYIPLNELTWDLETPEAADLLQVEQDVELIVLHVDSRKHIISLSLKRARKAA